MRTVKGPHRPCGPKGGHHRLNRLVVGRIEEFEPILSNQCVFPPVGQALRCTHGKTDLTRGPDFDQKISRSKGERDEFSLEVYSSIVLGALGYALHCNDIACRC